MNRHYLNLNTQAWRQLRRNWNLPASPMVLWQTLVPGSLSSLLSSVQNASAAASLAQAGIKDTVVILGYWRSGTTLLHEMMCLDPRYSFPTTHACMNPHHFLLTEASTLARGDKAIQRPMDEMEIRPGTPQEDEFALLCMGARSPYEALVVPNRLHEALKLSDPRDLPAQDEKMWRAVFLQFLKGVSVRGGGHPIILKSPTHGFRVSTLREVLPDARYVLIVRDPLTTFESVIRMWRKMFQLYAMTPLPSDDEIRDAVLADRPRFEAKVTEGTAGLPANRFATITFESLTADPVGSIEQLYNRLDLGDFEAVRKTITEESERRRGYQAKGSLPSPNWRERIVSEWSPIINAYAGLR